LALAREKSLLHNCRIQPAKRRYRFDHEHAFAAHNRRFHGFFVKLAVEMQTLNLFTIRFGAFRFRRIIASPHAFADRFRHGRVQIVTIAQLFQQRFRHVARPARGRLPRQGRPADQRRRRQARQNDRVPSSGCPYILVLPARSWSDLPVFEP
jgi:hypothetical protein